MTGFIANTFSSWHLAHPWTHESGNGTLTRTQKAISIVALIVTLPLAIVGGLAVFYAVTGLFKARQVKILQKENLPISAQKTDDQGRSQLQAGKSVVEDPIDTKGIDRRSLQWVECVHREIFPAEEVRLIEELTAANDTAQLNIFIIGAALSASQQIPTFAQDAASLGIKVKVFNIDPGFTRKEDIQLTAGSWTKVKKNHYRQGSLDMLYYCCKYPNQDFHPLAQAVTDSTVRRANKDPQDKSLNTVFMWTCSAPRKDFTFFKQYEQLALHGFVPQVKFVHHYEMYPALVLGTSLEHLQAIGGVSSDPTNPTPGTLYRKWYDGYSSHEENSPEYTRFIQEQQAEYAKYGVYMCPKIEDLSFGDLL